MNELSNVIRLPAVQYDFGSKWFSEIKPLFQRPRVSDELSRALDKYLDLQLELFEDGHLGKGEAAELHYKARILEAQARYEDLHWLNEHLEPYDLADLMLAIACELRPEEEWIIIEADDRHSVVSNVDRSMVFDIKLYDKLSAEESLLYVEDAAMLGREINCDRLNTMLDQRRAHLEASLEKMRELLAKGAKEGIVIKGDFDA